MSALGERFRAAREARGLSLSDVAEQIRIRSVYLAAIEDENWSVIGAPVYIRGFLRTYGRFLGLDTEEIVAEFAGEPRNAAGPVAVSTTKSTYFADEAPPPRQLSWLIWAASLVAVLLIAYVAYSAMTLHARQNPTLAALPSNSPGATAPGSDSSVPSASPSPSGSASPSPQASGTPGPLAPHVLELRLVAPSWVRVTVDGNVSMEGTFPAGTARRFQGKTAVLRIGNAGGVEVLVDGKDVGLLGKAGDVVERSFTL
ncbi:MAG TPA: RodZ domain-containing protein [Candidatus Baltobacteraceae bacterium]|nr:RodZ domain-containing protein [Candidatus Baltobacteraceae bacterium]